MRHLPKHDHGAVYVALGRKVVTDQSPLVGGPSCSLTFRFVCEAFPTFMCFQHQRSVTRHLRTPLSEIFLAGGRGRAWISRRPYVLSAVDAPAGLRFLQIIGRPLTRRSSASCSQIIGLLLADHRPLIRRSSASYSPCGAVLNDYVGIECQADQHSSRTNDCTVAWGGAFVSCARFPDMLCTPEMF